MALYKLTLIIFFVFAVSILNGQSKKPQHFGISIGVGQNNYKIKKSNWMQTPIDYNDSLNSISSKSSIGINLGLSYYLTLTKNILLRPTYTMTLPSTGKLTFERKSASETLDVRNISFTFSVPVNFKISTKGFNPYLTIAPGFSFLAQNDDVKHQVEFKTFDLLGQIGFGGEVPFKYFKIKPELLYSTGFSDMRKRKDNIYNNTISSLLQQNLSLTFYICNLNN
jgi:hypothetical protein